MPARSAAMASGSSGRRSLRRPFERALASRQPAILHCIVDAEAITPDRTLSQIRGSGAR
jgi:thiamine pyrophosphate-dependent acetolactate synthase large subunit-like protein